MALHGPGKAGSFAFGPDGAIVATGHCRNQQEGVVCIKKT